MELRIWPIEVEEKFKRREKSAKSGTSNTTRRPLGRILSSGGLSLRLRQAGKQTDNVQYALGQFPESAGPISDSFWPLQRTLRSGQRAARVQRACKCCTVCTQQRGAAFMLFFFLWPLLLIDSIRPLKLNSDAQQAAGQCRGAKVITRRRCDEKV